MSLRRWLVLLLVMSPVIVSACSEPGPTPRPTMHQAQVGPGGGSFTFGDTTVVVPPGAVDASASLTVADPSAVGDPVGVPLGVSGALKLDIAFDGGRLQPKMPLGLRWRLPDNVRAELRTGKLPLLYSSTADRTSFQMLPDTVDADGNLTAQLPHLSLKWLAGCVKLNWPRCNN